MNQGEQGGYCRRCGAATALSVPAGDTRLRPTCGRCGTVEYENPKIVIACVLYEGERVLWMRRRTPPYEGCWTLPSGFVECGETVAEAACREVFEETGLRIEPDRLTLYGVLNLPDINEVYISLTTPLPNHDYAPSAEAAEVRMITRAEVASLELGYPPPTFALLMEAYDAIARDELHQTRGRMWEIRGRDPLAERPGDALTDKPRDGARP